MLCSNGQFLSITESAAEILGYVVPQYSPDLFWIDQLCINQNDLVEKSAQVLMMGQIYSATKQVIAWLGRGDKGIGIAIKFVERLYGEVESMERKGIQPTLVRLMALPARVRNLPAQLQVSRKWNAFGQLLTNPWFERVWVMQEVVMACSETSQASIEKDQILLSFEKGTIDFYFLGVVLKVLASDHLISNIAYDDRVQDGQSNLGSSPPGVTAINIFFLHRELRG